MSSVLRVRKKLLSFFSEVFTTYKGFIILAYLIICLFLYWKYADKELLSNPSAYLTFALLPTLMWHLVGIFGAVSFLVILTFALGTCLFDKREIQSNIKNATLQQLAAFKKSRLVLFIPHRKAGYIEIELSTNGMTAPRMEELRREIQNALQKYTLVGKFQDGGAGEYDIVKFRVRKGKAKSKDSVLYA